MEQAEYTVHELMSSVEWPNILRELTRKLDTEGIGGITTKQLRDYLRQTGQLKAGHPLIDEAAMKECFEACTPALVAQALKEMERVQ